MKATYANYINDAFNRIVITVAKTHFLLVTICMLSLRHHPNVTSCTHIHCCNGMSLSHNSGTL